jgi:hypothetical protein
LSTHVAGPMLTTRRWRHKSELMMMATTTFCRARLDEKFDGRRTESMEDTLVCHARLTDHRRCIAKEAQSSNGMRG